MINVTAELDQIQTLVGQDGSETRYRHEARLRRVIAHLRAEGQAVPPRVKQLHQTLLSEAIEAEFDNMPV